MADNPQERKSPAASKLVDRDVIQVEFLIEDLISQLVKDPVSPVANCNGCSRCSAAIDLPSIRQGQGR